MQQDNSKVDKVQRYRKPIPRFLVEETGSQRPCTQTVELVLTPYVARGVRLERLSASERMAPQVKHPGKCGLRRAETCRSSHP